MGTLKQQISKSDLILLLLYSRGFSGKENEPIQGITRLMKLLFLLHKEEKFDSPFHFEPYKIGPFSSEVYPELEFLQSFPNPDTPLIKTSVGDATDSSVNPEQLKLADDIAILDDEDYLLAASEVNKEFSLSLLGGKVAKELWNDLDVNQRDTIEKIKKQYGNLTLRNLLKHVYREYPDMTINSEIKDQL